MRRSAVARIQSGLSQSLASPALPAGGLLVIAASGGPDSTALLHAAAAVAPTIGGRVAALHVNHGLRGESARRDAAAVAELAERLGIQCGVVECDTQAAAARWRAGLEAAARRLRYSALAQYAAAIGASAVATAHTLDDQAETVLLNLLRGSGSNGLTGMAPLQRWASASESEPEWERRARMPQLTLLRPLIKMPRSDTLAYCQEAGLSWCIDESNLDPRFARNRVRHHLLPLLATYNPGIARHLATLAEILAEDEAELERSVATIWDEVEVGPDFLRLSWQLWTSWSAALQRRVLRRAAQELSCEPPSFRAIELVRRLLARQAAGRSLELRGGLRVSACRSGALLRRGPSGPRSDQ